MYEERWKYSTKYRVNNSPTVSNGVVFVSSLGIEAVDIQTGEKIWTKSFSSGNVTSPVAVGDTVFVVGANNEAYALDAETGGKLWSTSLEGRVRGDLAVDSDTVYANLSHEEKEDIVCALDAETGAERRQFQLGGSGGVSPVIANDLVYAGSGNDIYAISIESGQQVWKCSLGDSIQGLSTASGRVYVADRNKVYSLDAVNGVELWRCNDPRRITTAPVVAHGTVYVGGRDGVTALNAL
jgi:outer membrane protein assembly factor BamB